MPKGEIVCSDCGQYESECKCDKPITADRIFRRKLRELLWHPPQSTYVSSYGGTYEDTDYFKFEASVLALVAKLLAHAREGYMRLSEDQTPPENPFNL